MATVTKRKMRRSEKAEVNRKALLRAAAKVVGKYGYADASIGRITEKCGLAQGTFYIYFESRQALFDELLPEVGNEMLTHIGKAVHGSKDFFELEERGMEAYFDYLTRNKGFFRILYEADEAAPEAARVHYAHIAERYRAVLERARREAQIRPLSAVEESVLTYLLMAVRDYMYRHIVKGGKLDEAARKELIGGYLNILRRGVQP